MTHFRKQDRERDSKTGDDGHDSRQELLVCRNFLSQCASVNQPCDHSAWRHWGCVTPKIIENLKKRHAEASDIDGFEEISEEDQRRVEKAYEEGHVADEDIPDTARKPAEDDKDKVEGKKKKASKKQARVCCVNTYGLSTALTTFYC